LGGKQEEEMGQDKVVIVTKQGQIIKLDPASIPDKKRGNTTNKGVKFAVDGDEVVGITTVVEE
jgi:DNA gyrase/topoisomerase IV subunit A